MTPEQAQAIRVHLKNAYDVLNGEGAHAEHDQRQVGRCVICSCGARVQGRMAKK